MMKDIVIVPEQIEVAAKLGASAVLLIQALFDNKCTEMTINKMISYAHTLDLEVLLEIHTEPEFKCALETKADLIGINNRNLATLKIDLKTTQQILEKQNKKGNIVVSESGIKMPSDLHFLRSCGADAFLVGSSIMLSNDIESKVKELVTAP
jgi:indole-3-glycerol phosphate synthase